MPPAYSMDLRVRVLADCQGGMTAPQAAAKYSVSVGWVKKVKGRLRATGSAAPGRPGNPRRPALEAHEGRLRQAVERRPDATLAELRQALGLDVSLSALCRHLQRLKLARKKSPCAPPSGTGPM
jgi:transposase